MISSIHDYSSTFILMRNECTIVHRIPLPRTCLPELRWIGRLATRSRWIGTQLHMAGDWGHQSQCSATFCAMRTGSEQTISSCSRSTCATRAAAARSQSDTQRPLTTHIFSEIAPRNTFGTPMWRGLMQICFSIWSKVLYFPSLSLYVNYSDTTSQAGSESGPPPPPPPAAGAAAAATGARGSVRSKKSKEELERDKDDHVRRYYSGLDIHPNLRSFMFWV